MPKSKQDPRPRAAKVLRQSFFEIDYKWEGLTASEKDSVGTPQAFKALTKWIEAGGMSSPGEPLPLDAAQVGWLADAVCEASEVLANVYKLHPDGAKYLRDLMADALTEINQGRFDRERFLAACVPLVAQVKP